MKVAALQLDIAWEDPPTNFRRASELAAEASAAGARLLVLPEMFATGFSMEARAMAAHARQTLEFLEELARSHRCWVLGGLAHAEGDSVVNLCVAVDPDGRERGRYRKIHPFSLAGEHRHYEAGKELLTLQMEGLRVTPLICYDLRFPELFRAAAADTDLFVVMANWPTVRSQHWRTLLSARAVDCLAWVLGVNRVGTSADGHPHRGDSRLVDPMGLVVASLAEQAGAVVAAVDRQAVATHRKRLGFLDDRRPELYPRLEPGNTGT